MFQAIFYNLADSNKLIDAFIAGTYKSFLTITESTLLYMSTEETNKRTIEQSCHSIIAGTFTEEKKDEWDEKLATVFNRGFWDGYYQGQTLGEWNKHYGSVATEKKVLVGKVMKYFSKLGVAEVAVEASTFDKGEKLLITGNTTGVMYLHADEIRYDLKPVETAQQGWRVSIPVPDKVRPNDKLYKLITVNEIKEIK